MPPIYWKGIADNLDGGWADAKYWNATNWFSRSFPSLQSGHDLFLYLNYVLHYLLQNVGVYRREVVKKGSILRSGLMQGGRIAVRKVFAIRYTQTLCQQLYFLNIHLIPTAQEYVM